MFEFDKKLIGVCDEALEKVKFMFDEIDKISGYNTMKVQHAFYKNRVSDTHFAATTGYGYGDRGRDTLDRVYADVFECEDALVRHNIVSGTHALNIALFSILRPYDTLLSITGKPYDTLDEIIGLSGEKGAGSLKDFLVNYKQLELKNGALDYDGIENAVDKDVKVVFIQRSKGYSADRKSLSCEEIGRAADIIKSKNKDAVIIVDNCYGEFVQKYEPTTFGADLIVGSLIKNPGGGCAKTGGYIAGRKDLIELVSYRLTSPGIGRECGASLGQNLDMYKGFYLAPHVVAQSLKTSIFCAAVYSDLGFYVSPDPFETRNDIILAITFKNADMVKCFCQGIQKGSPVDSFVIPQPWDMPGYGEQVIMAAGTFVGGASIELSADGPMREPYIAYVQGGLTFEGGKLGVMMSVQNLIDNKLIAL